MKNRIVILGSMALIFVFMAGMAVPGAASPGCDCSAHALTNSQTAR